MELACLDLEGVLIPEIWIKFAEKTGIEELQLTTRDEPDYDKLMKMRLQILRERGLGLPQIREVVATLDPLDGAIDFLAWLRQHFQVVILSDTYYEFVMPLIAKLGYPTILCHRLETDEEGMVTDYVLRQPDPKRSAVKAFHSLNYRVIAAGDSYNDTTMLSEADVGILFHAPANVSADFPQFPSVHTYEELQDEFRKASRFKIP